MVQNRKVIWATLSSNLLVWGLINSLFGPSSLSIMSEFKVDFATAGLAVAGMSFGAMFSIFTGRYVDKYGSYYIARLSLLFFGLTIFLAGLSNGILMFILILFLAGISIGTLQASFNQVIIDLYPDAKIKMLSITQAFFGVGSTVGPTIVALVISSLNSWKVGYMLFGGLLTVMVVFQFSLKSGSEKRTISFEENKTEEKDNSFFVLLIALFFMFIVGSGIGSWLPTYAVSSNKTGYLEASALLSCYWAAGTVMRVFGWKLVNKTGVKKALVSFTMIGFICSLISIFVIGFVPNAIIWGIVGLVYEPIYPMVMAVAYSKFRRNPGRAIGRLISFGNFGALISAPLIGTINNVSGPNVATFIIPISCLVATFMFVKLKID